MHKFNITGLCVPHMHYMADTSKKISQISAMVDEGLYFTINRARQYGKTTTFSSLRRKLSDKYLVIKTSFEGVGDEPFASDKNFCAMFADNICEALEATGADGELISLWTADIPRDMKQLGKRVTSFCEKSSKPVVMMIDEIDKTADNQVFLNFLGLLRDKYLRRNDGDDCTFRSVILAGVSDIKNLRRRITGEEILNARGERVFNSPWNIAADFKVDMSFNPAEIFAMLNEYESDYHTGMDARKISEELYRYTNGYPFLVSKLCKTIDEDLSKDWSVKGIKQAVKLLLSERSTLLDDVIKNLKNNPKLRDLVYQILIGGEDIPFSPSQSEIELGAMYGILVNYNGKTAVANEVFEQYILDYFVVDLKVKTKTASVVVSSQVIENGRLNMQLCLEKFGRHYYEMFDERELKFSERNGRLLFLTYLKAFINGKGFCHIEPGTRNALRMDLVVDYGEDQFIVELKLWRGEKLHSDAYAQLWNYLDAKNENEGYLLTFDFRKRDKTQKAEWVRFNGKRIFDVMV
ncbi:MAG: GxxExxY protein [Oscillospiraceae bacterium]|jgi:hypothetical protein|nr:GxxExxY protein [Oscillospiraceae bacterium]